MAKVYTADKFPFQQKTQVKNREHNMGDFASQSFSENTFIALTFCRKSTNYFALGGWHNFILVRQRLTMCVALCIYQIVS